MGACHNLARCRGIAAEAAPTKSKSWWVPKSSGYFHTKSPSSLHERHFPLHGANNVPHRHPPVTPRRQRNGFEQHRPGIVSDEDHIEVIAVRQSHRITHAGHFEPFATDELPAVETNLAQVAHPL